MNKVLEITQLTKKFGSFTAVNDVTFSVEKGNVYGLLGPNGSGKSTTLGMILNVINPTAGSWKWFGKEPDNDSLKKIGAIIESPKFYPYLSAQKNLEIVADIKEANYAKIHEKLELVGLLSRKKDKFQQYSLGMKQRLAIAAALLNDPEVLILDEPTNGLDPQGIIQIRELIIKIAQQGTTIILASHLLDEVEKVCSHVVVLNQGKMLYAGSVDQMNSSFGSIEVAAQNMESLEYALKTFSFVSKVTKENNKLLAVLAEEKEPAEINKMLYEQGIVVNHLVKRKESLEQQFFQLIQKQN
ncbi:ATP-binding cassette domain-containing protein [Empedobacter stercoris]|uniref:ATP-binding cassette domain-containing protein n=1 Tax=Empedobacter stercoris TaxID=1628248 RepID=A0ABX1WI70_9FLAO|nr:MULTISPECIES: ATP-binding cassette domain-containing protein [Empedobacter]MCA4808204.1 ATP-binding cassette domain-containing protein [Empedobacter stercoris]MDM1522818.1 ATP-binding cassette domain-containing protein [Empedobacter sp. 225-1]MDM1542878.1 ATP-binding cassette domain-containing protein [Empedobacter sp. 189-2]NOJ74358.1 ATP-binding cassette domain-containing protein [Empedobacter stercoris]QNT14348.1 ATP-binding cassette domain-containing protein [Empedobacter stercoris]